MPLEEKDRFLRDPESDSSFKGSNLYYEAFSIQFWPLEASAITINSGWVDGSRAKFVIFKVASNTKSEL